MKNRLWIIINAVSLSSIERWVDWRGWSGYSFGETSKFTNERTHICCVRVRPSALRLANSSRKFQKKFLTTKKNISTRERKFTPANFFHSIVQLVAGANHEGYNHALLKSFGFENIENTPSKGSFSKARKKISYKFFADRLNDLKKKFEPYRRTFRGLRIYAIDGQQIILPRTDDIKANGYTGRSTSRYSESYMPRAYLTHAYDVLSGVTKSFCFGPRLNEIADAAKMIKGFERNSLTLYDRLYFCSKLVLCHFKRKNYFIFRCRKNALPEIPAFIKDKKRKKLEIFYNGRRLFLVKAWNGRANEWSVFITNLPSSWIKHRLIRKLYRLRWEVEISFKELTATTKIEQWHSKFINGILQELFCSFWLINFVKIQMYFRVKQLKNPLQDEYQRPNFKLLFNWVVWNFPKLLQRIPGVLDEMEILIKKSTERRIHEARHYKREIKGPASPYPYNNTRWVPWT